MRSLLSTSKPEQEAEGTMTFHFKVAAIKFWNLSYILCFNYSWNLLRGWLLEVESASHWSSSERMFWKRLAD